MGIIKVKDNINNKEYMMTPEQIEAAYRYQEKKYRKEDAAVMLVERLEEIGGDKDDFKEEYGCSFDDAMKDIDYLAERFLDSVDCNTPENSTWNTVLDEYFDQRAKL